MSRALRTLIRKELTELRRDRRVLVLTLVLPVLLYPTVIGMMDRLQANRSEDLRERTFKVAVTEGDPILEAALRESPSLLLLTTVADSLRPWVEDDRVALGIELPKELASAGSAHVDTIRTVGRMTREAAQEIERRIAVVFDAAAAAERQRRFEAAGGLGELDAVLAMRTQDVSTPGESGGAEASRLLVYLLLMTLFMAAASLGTDMVAGEKERGTLETLFLAPLDRALIARSKLIVAGSAGALTGLMSLASLTISYRTGWIGGSEVGGAAFNGLTLSFVGILLIPLAVLLAAVMLVVSTWARSLKEAQYYVMPVMLLVFVPALLSMGQAVEINGLVAILPIANVAFVMRDVLAQRIDPTIIAVALLSTLVWIALAARTVTRLLSREETVLGFDPEPFFAASEGGRRRALQMAMTLTVVGYFYLGQWLQVQDFRWGLASSLWVLLPILGFGATRLVRGSRRPLRELLSLRMAPPRAWLGGAMIGWGVMLPMAGGIQRLQNLVLPMPTSQAEQFAALFEQIDPLLLFFLAAVSPALVEELVFRGLFLGHLLEQGSARRAILWSAFWFALIHLSIHRFVPTFILGVCMASLVVRHRSLIPAVIMHLCYNGTLLLGERWVSAHGVPMQLDGVVAWSLSLALLAGGFWVANLNEVLRARPPEVP